MHRNAIIGFFGSAALAVAAAWVVQSHGAQALDVRLAGDETVLFDTAVNACDDSHLPDAPARAFRDAQGRMVLFAPNFRNRAFVGQNLESLHKDCNSRFKAAGKADPGMLDDRTWLHAIYTDDGETVYALGSASFMPYRHDMPCANAKKRTDCWINGLVTLKSTDGGQHFDYQAKPPHHAPFPPPMAYRDDRKRAPSYVTATNIVRWNDYLYSIVWRRGADWKSSRNCLARANADDPSRWQIWDGKKFVDAARLTPDKGWEVYQTDCARVGPYGLTSIRGIVRHEASNTFIAVYKHRRKHKDGTSEHGIYYSTSKDMIKWSMPKMLLAADLKPDAGPGDAFVAYPSIIDEDSKDRIFGTVDAQASLLYVKLVPVQRNGKWAMTRKLMRQPIRFNSDEK
ncbi:hypothetical protein [Thalassospira sp.]|uniref:hypothetical protein n=1 Tax=Thalassospira sp. TaxID=1912094 RepID=UPI003AA96B27